MIVVSNASALINMGRIGKLNLLHELYGEIVIPEAVWQEVVIDGAGQPGSDEVRVAAWIKKLAANNSHLVHALQQDLDAGEAEAIALSSEIRAGLLLMDERLGRETAHHLGLRCLGLIGVFIEARRKGLINAVKPHLNEFCRKALKYFPGIEFMPEAPYGRSNCWLTVILIAPEQFGADREAVRLALEKENIESRPIWKPMHMQPVFHVEGRKAQGGRRKRRT
jgi:predicted nucleic acid-binding protein